MRTALLGGTALAVVVVAAIWLSGGVGGGRLPAPLPTEPASNSFVIHDAAPAPAPAAPGNTDQSSNLDALMQRMRDSKAGATVVVTPAPASTPSTPATSASAPASAPASSPTAAVSPLPAPPTSLSPQTAAPGMPTPLMPIAMQWTNVTSQGTRWRFGRGAHGFLLSIDLGGGQVADVRVQPSFQNLDVPAVNTRVDYLKATILQNFSSASATYSFARDGSVSLDR